MPQYDYDLFVIGAGSGGVRAARLAGAAGARVAIAEDDRIGGTCVIRGCVPKKLFTYAAEFSQHFEDAKLYGWSVDNPRFDWPTLRDNVQAEVARLSGLYRETLGRNHVVLHEERASVTGPNNVRLNTSGKSFTAERILIATGGHTSRPLDIAGCNLGISSTEAFLLEKLPERILVAGGGYIALEFASVFAGLGVATTLVYRGDKVLRGFDDDVRAHVQAEMALAGIEVITKTNLTAIEETPGGGRRVTLDNGKVIETDQVLLALGREPNTKGLGLEDAGVRMTARGAVAVDVHSRTNVPSIFAVGDVTDRINLTPVAIREAQAFVETEFLNRPTAFDHADVASAVFSHPPVGAVGLTEAAARERFGAAKVFRANFRPMKNTISGNPHRALMKLIVHPSDDRVVGIHLAGPDSPEMIQIAAVAVKAGLTKAQWDATCAVHPTAAEELVLMHTPIPLDPAAPA